MKINRHILTGSIVIALVMSVLIFGVGRYCWDWWHRPLFYNVFRGNDRTSLPFWQAIPPPQTDRFGNLYYIDWDLNLFVIIATGEPYCYPEEPIREGSNARIPNRQLGMSFLVPRQRDALLLLSRTGKVRTFPLRPGDAGKLWSKGFADNDYPTDPFQELGQQYGSGPSTSPVGGGC